MRKRGRWVRLLNRQRWKRYDRRRGNAVARFFIVTAFAVLYGMPLPLLRLPVQIKQPLCQRVKGTGKTVAEEMLPIRYASKDGNFLSVSKLQGDLPVYTMPVHENMKVDVKRVLEERFGNLEEVSFQSFLSNHYIEDSSTKATTDVFDLNKMLNKDLTIEKSEKPQILIFHTHTSEGYADSRPGEPEDTVSGAGTLLAEILRETYGYQVIHETRVFDRKADGSDDRNNAYNNALPVITAILEQYPSIEVVIDLHRDSGEARTSVINGVSTAKVMLFNGLCRNKDGPISYYSNKNLTGNLAFSLHLQVAGNELYPGLMHRIYLKSYRYNMHLKEKYLLVELGTHKNTVAEAMAAMPLFAETIANVLSPPQ